jgi:serine/threonine protein kinase
MRIKCGLLLDYGRLLQFILSHLLMVFKVVTFYHRRAFRDELALLQRIRHPNVVQFLGAVTQSSPMMIVTEYLAKVFLSLHLLAYNRVVY